MKYLFMVGIALVIFGICFLITFSKEKAKKYALVQGKVIEVIKSVGVNGTGVTYTVELRVYEDKPDKAIANSKKNLIMPLILGTSFIILGVVLFVIFALFK